MNTQPRRQERKKVRSAALEVNFHIRACRIMAARAARPVVDALAPFLLGEVKDSELDECAKNATGQGAYGYVFKFTVNGVQRIAKKVHGTFVNGVSAREKRRAISKFRDECIILSKLRHPNIVQFVGVHYGRGGMTDLTLFMECLSSDMGDFLSSHLSLSLSLKLSLLQDVSFGLVYLHEQKDPIVHRDLTARNILISDRYQAKIADLGMAKIVDLQAQLAASHTQVPGQQHYMPPEALKENASCTPKLDIFSFGHLALYTVIQELPEVYDVTESLTMKMKQDGTIQRERRRRFIDAVGEGHCLYPIITECLFDNPDQRPTTRDLNSRLFLLASRNPMPESTSIQIGECIELRRKLAELSSQNAKLDDIIKKKDESFVGCHAQITTLRSEGQQLEVDLKRAKEEIKHLELRVIEAEADLVKERKTLEEKKETQILVVRELVAKYERERNECYDLTQENAQLKLEHADLEQEKARLDRKRTDLQQEKVQLELENADLKHELERRKSVKTKKIRHQLHEAAKGNVKLVEQLEEVRKEKNELLKQIKKEQRKAEKQESSQVPDTQETVAEELKSLRLQVCTLSADSEHYRRVIATLSMGIINGSALFQPTDDFLATANRERSNTYHGSPAHGHQDPTTTEEQRPIHPQAPRPPNNSNTDHRPPVMKKPSRGRQDAASRPFSPPAPVLTHPTCEAAVIDRRPTSTHQPPPRPHSSYVQGDFGAAWALSPLNKQATTEARVVDNGAVNKTMIGLQQDMIREMRTRTMENRPYDENLTCPTCGKRHREGELQKFQQHVGKCDGGFK